MRKKAAADLANMEVDGQMFDGFGIVVAKERLGQIVGGYAHNVLKIKVGIYWVLGET